MASIPLVRGNGGGRESFNTNATAGATPTIDLGNGNVHNLTLTANVTSLTITGQASGVACSFTLILHQDATGSRTVTWPAAVKWPSATAPTLSTAASAVDILTFVTIDNGTTWYGFLSGKGMS